MSGKWHCNGKFNSPQQPQPDAAGFDHWFATQNNASPSHENPRNFVRNGKAVGPLKGFSCQLVMDEALTWLKRQRAKDAEQSFFLYVAFHEPHEPVASPKEMVEEYQGVAKNVDQAHYFANVSNLDAAVGKLMEALKSMEVDQNTLVVFTSDNGPETLLRYGRGSRRSFGSPKPLRGMKLWTTDAGFRVAGIMHWPARIEAGQVVSHPVSALDFLPTFCELAGTQPPKDLALDGASFLPVLNNQPIQRKKPLVWVYYNALNKRRVAMRDGDWKILAKLDIGKLNKVDARNEQQIKGASLSDFQIFDLSKDIGEKKDLAKANPQKLAELKQRLEAHYKELVDGSHVWDK